LSAYSAFKTAWRWGSFIAAHAIVACVLIGAIQLVQHLLFLFGDPKLFDAIPLRYIFDVMDLAIAAAFIVLGTLEAITVFREKQHER
jgi:hypothetical protein